MEKNSEMTLGSKVSPAATVIAPLPAPQVQASASPLSVGDQAALEGLLREYGNIPVLGPGRCGRDVLRDAEALISRMIATYAPLPTVTLSGHQLRDALEFVNPDGTAGWEQGEDELMFGVVKHQADDGAVKTGMCCWNDDTDGVFPLDGEYLPPVASPKGLTGEGRWVPCTPALLLAGVSCADTPRRCGENHSHDHWISHCAAPLPVGSAQEEQRGRRLLQGAQSVCGMFGHSEAELVDWLTRDGGLFLALQAYQAVHGRDVGVEAGVAQ